MSRLGRVLVTGASGFVGRHLCPALIEAGATDVLAWGQHGGAPAGDQSPALDWQPLEITDEAAVLWALRRFAPEVVIHLAAQSHVPTAFENPAGTWTTNTLGTLYLLEALSESCPHATFLYVSSGDVYGAAFRADRALDESVLPRPTNPYSASKAAAELLVQQYGSRGLETVCLRPFNHIGPGQGSGFVVAAFAHQIARIEAGLQAPVLQVGNLEAWRDFTDVRDVVAAYVECVRLARSGVMPPNALFNLCSGKPRRIQSVLDELLVLSTLRIEVRPDPERLRPSDTPYAAGDAARLREATGWEPLVPWQQTLADVLDDWRGRAGRTLGSG